MTGMMSGRMSRVLWVTMVVASVLRMLVCGADRRGGSAIIGIVWLIMMRVSVVEGRGWKRAALVVVRVMVARVGGVGSGVRRVGALGWRSVVRVHGTVGRPWEWAARHSLRPSIVGPRWQVSICVRMHGGCGLGVVRVSVLRIRVV